MALGIDARCAGVIIGFAAGISAIVGCHHSSGDCEPLCVQLGMQSRTDGGPPPVNHCAIVHGVHACVTTCATNVDCDGRFYSGCRAKADDGRKICADLPR
jgi:hypothetical protein